MGVMERQPCLLCFGAILLRCEGVAGLHVHWLDCQHGHGSSTVRYDTGMIVSDIRVIKW